MAKKIRGLSSYSEAISLKKIFHILFKRKVLILFFLAGSVLVALAMSYLFSPVYETDAGIFVRMGRETLNLPASVIRSEMVVADPVMTQLNNEVNLLSSEKLIKQAVERLGIEYFLSEPETLSEKFIHSSIRLGRWLLETTGLLYPLDRKEKVILKLRKNLEIVPENDSRMITVHFFSKNPEQGVKFLNTLLPLYLEAHLEAYSYDNESKLFYEEMHKALKEWQRAIRDLEAYKQKWNITAPEIEQKELISRISNIEMALKTAGNINTEKMNKQTMNSLDILSRAAENPVLSSLAMKLIDMEVLRDSMSAQYTDEYKPYRDIKRKISRLRKRLSSEISKSGAVARNMLESLKERLTLVSKTADTIRKMNQEIDLKRKRYEFLLGKYEESVMLQAMNHAKIANVTVTEPPSVKPAPVTPKRMRNILLAVVFGLFGGIWAAMMYEYLRRTISFPEDLENRGIPFLASFPHQEEGADMSVSCEGLYFALKPQIKHSGGTALMFTSARHGEGTSTVADLFARYLADNVGCRVLLVDADLRTSELTRRYGQENMPGLRDMLVEQVDIENVVRKSDRAGLYFMPAGGRVNKPGRVYHVANFDRRMADLKKKFDVVIFDTAPAAAYPDFASFAGVAHGVILVVEAEVTKAEVVEYAVVRIEKVCSRFLGAVINKRRQFIPKAVYRYI